MSGGRSQTGVTAGRIVEPQNRGAATLLAGSERLPAGAMIVGDEPDHPGRRKGKTVDHSAAGTFAAPQAPECGEQRERQPEQETLSAELVLDMGGEAQTTGLLSLGEPDLLSRPPVLRR
jgi:hypothetical protein